MSLEALPGGLCGQASSFRSCMYLFFGGVFGSSYCSRRLCLLLIKIWDLELLLAPGW